MTEFTPPSIQHLLAPVRRYALIISLLLIILTALTGCDGKPTERSTSHTGSEPSSAAADMKPKTLPAASYVGGAHCQSCHQQEHADWSGSHHDLAMQPATSTTVLGDFDESVFSHRGIDTRFSRTDGVFKVETQGADGATSRFDVLYTFGVYPLQQYLVSLPGGRLQALSVAWDTRPAEDGGQRWFHLYPDEEISPTDPLHWTARSHNWNLNCAECHSTHLQKNYDAKSQTYQTQWSDIDVNCEACHGPASNHLIWADQQQRSAYRFGTFKGLTHRFSERENVHWSSNETSGQPERSRPRTTETEIQVCAACHSRRSQQFEDDRRGQPLLDSFLPSTLDEGLYHADGQIDDEVYVYGSFLQSKMYHAGVTCSDCHNPHSTQLKAEGANVCLQCHSPDYQTPKHHFHQVADPAKQPDCLDCHMPGKLYMQVDYRRDHSFRIPRPDLTDSQGVPNSCNACHTDKTPQWASDALVAHYGHKPIGFQQFAQPIFDGRAGATNAGIGLASLLGDDSMPSLVRATAAASLDNYLSNETVTALASALQDDDRLTRIYALESLAGLSLESRWSLARPLLNDRTRLVRTTAANLLADLPLDTLAPADKRLVQRGYDEYLQAQQFSADTPQGLVNAAQFLARRAQYDEAEKTYRQALDLDKSWLPSYVNYADLLRQLGRDQEGRELLMTAIKRYPQSADAYHSLGLLEVREKNSQAALAALKEAASLAPANGHYQYVYGVALLNYVSADAALRFISQQSNTSPQLEELRQQIIQR